MIRPARKKVRLIHTSDTHLGDGTGHPRSEKALIAVIEAVPRLEGDALLLVGDVFDNDRIPDSVLEFFLDQIRRLQVPAVVLPGNHDLYDENSLYHREPFLKKPPNLHIFTKAEGECITLPELTLDLWGRAMPSHTPQFSPLSGMPTADNGHWLVALAHGHFHFDYDKDQRSSPIYPQEIAEAPCDYLALGHWDRHEDVSQGRVKAAYSGCPLGPSRADPVGSVTVVDLDPQLGVQLSRAALENPAG